MVTRRIQAREARAGTTAGRSRCRPSMSPCCGTGAVSAIQPNAGSATRWRVRQQRSQGPSRRSSGVTALATAEARAFATEMPTFMPSLARCAGNPSLSLGEALGLADSRRDKPCRSISRRSSFLAGCQCRVAPSGRLHWPRVTARVCSGCSTHCGPDVWGGPCQRLRYRESVQTSGLSRQAALNLPPL